MGTVLLGDRGDVALLKLDRARSGSTPVRYLGRASTAPVTGVLRDAGWLVGTAMSGGPGGGCLVPGRAGYRPRQRRRRLGARSLLAGELTRLHADQKGPRR